MKRLFLDVLFLALRQPLNGKFNFPPRGPYSFIYVCHYQQNVASFAPCTWCRRSGGPWPPRWPTPGPGVRGGGAATQPIKMVGLGFVLTSVANPGDSLATRIKNIVQNHKEKNRKIKTKFRKKKKKLYDSILGQIQAEFGSGIMKTGS